jgi:hypothetical protein
MPLIQLIIEHDTESGQIQVSGPIDNELYCYGLLEKARQAVVANQVKSKSGLVAPHFAPRGGNG